MSHRRSRLSGSLDGSFSNTDSQTPEKGRETVNHAGLERAKKTKDAKTTGRPENRRERREPSEKHKKSEEHKKKESAFTWQGY